MCHIFKRLLPLIRVSVGFFTGSGCIGTFDNTDIIFACCVMLLLILVGLSKCFIFDCTSTGAFIGTCTFGNTGMLFALWLLFF